MFIVIEGADASGKATQARMLGEHFVQRGHDARLFAFPRYATKLGMIISEHLASQLHLSNDKHDEAMIFQCMMTVDRYDAAQEIRDLQQRGQIIIADRWWQSGYVYGKLDGLDPQWLFDVHGSLPQPDLNIFIAVPPDEIQRRLLERAARTGVPRDRYESSVKYAQVEDAYRDLWQWRARGVSSMWPIVDGARSPLEVHEHIWAIVQAERQKII